MQKILISNINNSKLAGLSVMKTLAVVDSWCVEFKNTPNTPSKGNTQIETSEFAYVISENEHFAALIPPSASNEAIIVAKRKVGQMLDFSDHERLSMAKIINRLALRQIKVSGVCIAV